MKNANGKEDTAFTVQYDFVMPKRFNLNYVNEQGEEEQAIVVHRSSIGAIERIIAFLIEHYAGAFPTWLAPVQTVILPISDKHLDYAKKIESELKSNNIRVELNDKNEPLNARVRDAEMQKAPYILVVGDRESEANSVSVRRRGQKQSKSQPVSEFASHILHEISTRATTTPNR